MAPKITSLPKTAILGNNGGSNRLKDVHNSQQRRHEQACILEVYRIVVCMAKVQEPLFPIQRQQVDPSTIAQIRTSNDESKKDKVTTKQTPKIDIKRKVEVEDLSDYYCERSIGWCTYSKFLTRSDIQAIL
ncbi:hypothetical protein Ahy_B05g074940 isoform G [Arachis hypogaea]|uniref:Uncharacterized protein n=1 Tax=Arachis hypogaea TaxID=3818 RepID=A0A444Z069_ARAHY|nr:hypothetical protein Ahy_B05g074940 isoform G [Arachis hypogaea]